MAEREAQNQPVAELVEHFFRHQWGATVSGLAVRYGVRHLDAIEDAVQDALIAALRVWPLKGIPSNPGAWIYTAARNRLIDLIRHMRFHDGRDPEQWIQGAIVEVPEADAAGFRGEVRDEQLAMIFACCHPEVAPDARVALTLKLVCGLSTREIAAAFVVEESTIAQRIHRSKARLMENGTSVGVPTGRQLQERMESVLSVLYLLFNEGYSTHGHENLVRFELCAEALRLVRLLISRGEDNLPEVRALAALFCLQSARLPARTDTCNELVLLEAQDRAQWDQPLIAEGLEHLRLAARGSQLSRYHLEAGIAVNHAVAADVASTDWHGIRYYYDQLCELYQSPVYELNRAIAVAAIEGEAAALAVLQEKRLATLLSKYYLYHAALADLNRRLGHRLEAIRAYETAAVLVVSATEKRFLQRRIGELGANMPKTDPSTL